MNRAIGLVRVSETGGRNGDRFHSPGEQRERFEAVCQQKGLDLIGVESEMDVSGRKPLDRRPGLVAAVEAIEQGRADVIIAAYFDRLFRSLMTQAEVIQRVEKAGGRILAVDVGHVTSASAAQWLSATMIGAVAEYYSRSVGERLAGTQARCVARGVAPFELPAGYRRRADGVAEPDPATSAAVVRAWKMRADGRSVFAICEWLGSNGVRVSGGGLSKMLRNHFYLGELHFSRAGIEPNLTAHDPLIGRDLFERVQRTHVTAGRRAKSERLLARLEVLRCECGARMSAESGPPAQYRCVAHRPRNTISASIAEKTVSDAVRAALRDAHGRASIAESAQEAVSRLSSAQEGYESALRVFSLTGAENESAAVERLAELRRIRDEAQAEIDQIGPGADLQVNANVDWDALSLDGKRALIRATVRSATVAPANGTIGAARITVALLGRSRLGQ